MNTKQSSVLKIGDWLFHAELNQLERDGRSVHLEPRVGDLLGFLAENADRVASRAEIMDAIWPNVVVGDEAINNAINKLRRALDDDSHDPEYIETLPKLGYRLIAPVKPVAQPDTASPASDEPAGSDVDGDTVPSGAPLVSAKASWRGLLLGGFAAVMLAVATTAYFHFRAPADDSPREAGSGAAPTSDSPSILVMPFKNIGNDPEDGIFIDGMTVDVITDLSKLSNLLVIANQTALSFKDRDITPRDAGRELGVKYILDGNIRRDGKHLRINAQLIESQSGYSLWAERYDRLLDNIFEIQDEITASIVRALSIRLTSQEEAAIKSIATTDFHAYELFLAGLRKYNTHIREDSDAAIEYYRRALEIDPGFARVYGALGIVQARNFRLGWTDSPAETLDRALVFARKAVEVDNTVPQVYWALGFVHLHRKEFDEAAAAAEQAIRLAPNYADAYGLLALIQNARGNWREAIGNITRGMRLNPYYSYDYPYNLGRAYYLGGQYEKAIEILAQALEKNQMAEMPRLYTIASQVRLGNLDDAAWEIEQLSVLHPNLTAEVIERTFPQDDGVLREFIADLRRAGLP